jgi:hypothetical protein
MKLKRFLGVVAAKDARFLLPTSSISPKAYSASFLEKGLGRLAHRNPALWSGARVLIDAANEDLLLASSLTDGSELPIRVRAAQGKSAPLSAKSETGTPV